jgi:methylphosphotriester-DNA--protein-cysteine methyltransferase
VAHAIRIIEKLFTERREGSALLVDLWGRAEACRALWFETYVLWPKDKTAERRRALAETVLQLASESIGTALRFSRSCQQFVDFVAKVAAEIERLKTPNA